jgi:hypothetical protein
LKLAVYSILESWLADPSKFNLLNQCTSQESTKSTVINFTCNHYRTTHLSSYYNQNSYIEIHAERIANEAAILYEKMVEDFTNETMTNIAINLQHNISQREKNNLVPG